MIQSVSQEAETIAWKILLETNHHGLVPVDPNDVAFYLRSLLFRTKRRLDYWTMPKLSAALNELRTAGVVRILVQSERAWLELHEDLRYHRFVNQGAKPTEYAETTLPLSVDQPELVALPPPKHSNERREEQRRKEGENARTWESSLGKPATNLEEVNEATRPDAPVDDTRARGPTLAEVLSVCNNQGIDKKIGEIWFNEMSSTDWRNGKGQDVSQRWQFALSAYAQKWFANNAEREKFNADKKKPAKADYKRNYLPPPHEPSAEEIAASQKIVREASAKLRAQFGIG